MLCITQLKLELICVCTLFFRAQKKTEKTYRVQYKGPVWNSATIFHCQCQGPTLQCSSTIGSFAADTNIMSGHGRYENHGFLRRGAGEMVFLCWFLISCMRELDSWDNTPVITRAMTFSTRWQIFFLKMLYFYTNKSCMWQGHT